jgi:hypothetical protein
MKSQEKNIKKIFLDKYKVFIINLGLLLMRLNLKI